MTNVYGYRFLDLVGDYIRAVIGMAVCAAPFVFVEPAPIVADVLYALIAIFCLLFLSTALRNITHISVDEEAIEARGLIRRRILWTDLGDLRISYFSSWNFARAQRTVGHDAGTHDVSADGIHGGWLQMRLKSGHTTIRIASGMDGFRDVLHRAVAAALRNHLVLNNATRANLEALGIGEQGRGA
jgi:hypothetical protein